MIKEATPLTQMSSNAVEVLAAGGKDLVAAAKGGRLCISGKPTSVARVCDAAVCEGDRDVVVAITLEKEVVVLARDSSRSEWQICSTHLLQKRPTDLSFSPKGTEVIVSDGFGDVYKFPLSTSVSLRGECNVDEYRMLGHFSTVTSLAMSSDLIATADRDSKLRISRFPQAFVIESFCLAHEGFITCVRWVSNDRLLSAAGDGTLRLWDARVGRLLDTFRCPNEVSGDVVQSENVTGDIVVTSVCVFPMDADIAAYSVYGSCHVFVIQGLLSKHPVKIMEAFSIKEDNVLTGMVSQGDKWLWVSTKGGNCQLKKYRVSRKGAVVGLDYVESMTIGKEDDLGNEKESSNKGGDKGQDVSRFEWLNQQRKREMVEDWKGKKRKHVEI